MALHDPEDRAGAILAVTSRRFTWTKGDGFAFRPGSEETEGLNRTREGALARIASAQTFQDARHRSFLASIMGGETAAMVSNTTIQHRDGEHVVDGRMYSIVDADIGD